MSTLTTGAQLTLLELAKRKDPSGNLAVIAEVLTQDNEILDDAIWMEANDTFSNKTVRRNNLPAGSWRKLNAGVATEASATTEVVDTIGMLETYAEADKDLVDAAPNPKTFRSNEATAFLEGLSQTLAATVIYGNASTDPEKFTGLAPRLDVVSQQNVYSNGGSASGAQTSLYVVQWGENRVHMVYPKGSKSMGIMHQDLGEVTAVDSSNYMHQVYRDRFQIKCGLVVKDVRSIARVCNIRTTSGVTGLFDEDYLIEALNNMPKRGAGAVIYAPTHVLTVMDIAAKDKSNVLYNISDLWGRPTVTFRGFPVRKVDQIVLTESVLT